LFFLGDEAIMSDFIDLFFSVEAHDGFLASQNKIFHKTVCTEINFLLILD